MVNPHKIKYNNTFSTALVTDLLVCVAFEGDNGEVGSYLNKEAVATETYDGRYRRVHSYKYNEFFSPKFTFIKKNFGDFEMKEVREVLKWLTSTSQPALLEVYYEHEDDNVAADFATIGNWTEINTYKAGNNRTIGVTATFESTMPYALSSLYTITKTIADPTDNKITITIDTDEPQVAVYPRVKVKHNGLSIVNIPTGTVYDILSDMVPNTVYYNGSNYYWKSDLPSKCTGATKPTYSGWKVVVIDHPYGDADVWEENTIYYYENGLTNNKYYWIDPYTFKVSTSNPNLSTTSVRIRNKHIEPLSKEEEIVSITTIKNNNLTEEITIDGANKIVYSNSVNRIFGEDFNLEWLELYDGTNEITIEGNCEIELLWRTPLKIGEW
jgi:hypothetical protein